MQEELRLPTDYIRLHKCYHSDMKVDYVVAAVHELHELPVNEQTAMANAFEKLQLYGDRLAYPHSSQVQGTTLRELRPRAGRSPWRALYQRVGDTTLVAAIIPEAQHDPRKFRRGVVNATDRIARYLEGT